MGSFLSRAVALWRQPLPGELVLPQGAAEAAVAAGLWPVNEGRLALTGELAETTYITEVFEIPLEVILIMLVMMTLLSWMILAMTCC